MWATAAVVTPTMTELLRTKDGIKTIFCKLFDEAERAFTDKGRVTEDILTALQSVFPSSLLPACELVDKGAITRVVSPSRSGIYQVVGASGVIYTCFESSTYCSCPAYRFSVLHKEDQLMCKHHLAMRLSNITRKTKVTNLTDQQMAQLLSSLG
ncbi:zinc finger SWIM domain-containing protein 7-like isoform X2 [Pomacea canaliculata]|uniref:zinc finger SWIM domain-containing protein 7-like isoform X2 n=1 Tax=Pomacea canaliculata TaxID=400727 RepID=UPI000D73718E|nr:zinc finger SWIM domain-containing protein 7-like isoform X2 [Pomacea canaliculata]